MTRDYERNLEVSTRDEKSKRGRASTLSDLPESQCSRCVATYNELIAYAGNDGSVAIRTWFESQADFQLLQDSSEWIEVMAFSPDGAYLAVGSHDNYIYVYRTSDWGL